MKKINLIVFLSLLLSVNLFSQNKNDKEKNFNKAASIKDRAAGIHNASNIGLFFENRGKLYPRTLTQGPSGEYPINSGRHYIYRMNPMVAFPNNVIQGRFTTDEEWEAASGYHNLDSAQIAFSDKPYTWNKNLGWPVKDAEGNPVFKSTQDSYCVYNDSGNTKQILGIEIIQTGYAYGISFAQNMIFFKFQVINKGNQNLKGMYFNIYMDCDVGDGSGGVPEYQDDLVGIDPANNLAYMYDSDGFSEDWKGKTGVMGVVLLKTPEVNGVEPGMTDAHYMVFDYDVDVDSIQYGVMSSSRSLYNSSLSDKYFHVASSQNIHFDDPAKLPATGGDLLFNMSSGPYDINQGDTLTFITAVVAGDDLPGFYNSVDQARNTVNANFELPKPPETPTLTGIPGDGKAILFWNDVSEKSIDKFSGEIDFEGYRIYRSNNRGVSWEKIADFDVKNSIGDNTGINYSFNDTTIINGFEYWYSITAYDRGNNLIPSLESPIGNTLASINTVSVIPRSNAIGREPVSGTQVNHIGSGSSNYELLVNPIDNESLSGNEYKINFSFLTKKEIGDLKTKVEVQTSDSSKTKPYKYGISFTTSSSVDILNLTTGETIGRSGLGYPPGGRSFSLPDEGLTIKFTDEAGTAPEFLPEAGDLVTINFALNVVKNNNDTVIYSRPFEINQKQATNDGVIFSLIPPSLIQNISRVGGSDNIEINFQVNDESLIENEMFLVSIIGNGINSNGDGFVNILVKNSQMDTLAIIDSLINQSTFSFSGIEGTVNFEPYNPPSAGNIFSLETVQAKLPNIQDAYSFKIKSSIVNTELQNSELNKIRVVPNPYVASSLFEPELGELRREPLRQIQFINLPSECTIYIFSVNADLVKTLKHNSQSGTQIWDLRTESGREVAPGVYIYVVKTAQTQYMERFAIIK